MFIKFFLQLQDNIRLYHWMTTSFARHKATDELYSKLSNNIDKFVEVYFGKYGRANLHKKDVQLNLDVFHDRNIADYIKQAVHTLLNDIPKGLHKNDTDLLNIRDEIVADLHQALYLFTLS